MPPRFAVHASSLPPPRPRCLPRSPVSLALYHDDQPVAWIAGDALGFGGFADRRVAIGASWTAYRALARWVSHRCRATLALPDAPRLWVADDAPSGERWIHADALPIARLFEASDDGHATTDAHADRVARPAASIGFEIAVPFPLDDVGMRRAAYAVYRALCLSGLPWRVWRDGPHVRRVMRFASADGDGDPGSPSGRTTTVVAPRDADARRARAARARTHDPMVGATRDLRME